MVGFLGLSGGHGCCRGYQFAALWVRVPGTPPKRPSLAGGQVQCCDCEWVAEKGDEKSAGGVCHLTVEMIHAAGKFCARLSFHDGVEPIGSYALEGTVRTVGQVSADTGQAGHGLHQFVSARPKDHLVRCPEHV